MVDPCHGRRGYGLCFPSVGASPDSLALSGETNTYQSPENWPVQTHTNRYGFCFRMDAMCWADIRNDTGLSRKRGTGFNWVGIIDRLFIGRSRPICWIDIGSDYFSKVIPTIIASCPIYSNIYRYLAFGYGIIAFLESIDASRRLVKSVIWRVVARGLVVKKSVIKKALGLFYYA